MILKKKKEKKMYVTEEQDSLYKRVVKRSKQKPGLRNYVLLSFQNCAVIWAKKEIIPNYLS